MNKYEKLMSEYQDHVVIREATLPKGLKGYYSDGVILINKAMETPSKYAVLAEELGHHFTSSGDIVDQSVTANRQQERVARRWGYEKTVPLISLLGACRGSFDDIDEVCDNLMIEPEHLHRILESYATRYGDSVTLDGYRLHFKPLYIEMV